MKRNTILFALMSLMLLHVLGCNPPGTSEPVEEGTPTAEPQPTPTQTLTPLPRQADLPTATPEPEPTPTPTPVPVQTDTPTPEPTLPPTPAAPTGVSLIQPADLAYLGAFRLPGPDEAGWAWGGSAMTYYPQGDPDGPADSYPGSIFGAGHDASQFISEVSIPVPVISADKDVEALNTAETLQDFRDVRGDLYAGRFYDLEMPRVGLAYLPRQGSQATDKLHFSWAIHAQEGDAGPTHGWCELDLSDPQPAGIWQMGGYWNYLTADYLFDIPPSWADAHMPGKYLATGRFREGGQGGQGPSLFAFSPWNEGNPPPGGSTLSVTPLLLYGNVYEENPAAMNDYQHCDEWSGGAWLTAGDKAAVVFVGTKGQGDCWYGFVDGTVWPDEPPYPPVPPDGDRGFWATRSVGQILFYSPDDLAAVAQGRIETWGPQPYATLNVDPYLYGIESEQQLHHVGAASFDRARGLLYVFEPLADGDKPLIHVWRVG
jgi:hypothetical protein